MTTSQLADDLRRDEGLRLEAYPDPISRGEPYTIGYGHTGGVTPGQTCTQDEAESWLQADIQKATLGLDRALDWWRELSDLRQDVLANMAFNMGVGELLTFSRFLAAARGGDWQAAHDQMLDSRWAIQVSARATRLAAQMLTGEAQS